MEGKYDELYLFIMQGLILNEVMRFNTEKVGKKLPQFEVRLEMPKVPRAFMNRAEIKRILCHTAAEFGFEEQQALYFYCLLDVPINEISEKVGLSQNHVASVLGLYTERLTNQLNLFKRTMPYDPKDVLPVSEILL